MSIRVRLIVLILLVGILPTVGAMVWVTIQMDSLVVSSGQAASEAASSGAARAITAEIYRVTDVVSRGLVVFAAIAGLLSLGAAVFIGISLTAPLRGMADGIARVMEGEWDAIPPSERKDELGVLSRALRNMALRLQEVVMGLEEQVADRIDGLQAVADVSRAATSVLDPDELIHQTVELVRERFGLYYVGLFLIDEGGQYCVLRAGTGDAGRQMLAQGHQLEAGGSSMIGQCVARDEVRIAMDVGREAVRFENPLLPDTRSELALPMRSRGRVIGAMTVQSEEGSAFDAVYVSVLQAMADQVAVAIDNAQLYADAQAAVAELEAIQQHLTSQAWTEYAQMGGALAYETQHADGASLGDTVLPEIQQALARHGTTVLSDPEHHTALVTPISLRGVVIGALGIHDHDANRRWTDDDLALVQAVVERMGVIADGLRLLDDAQRREASERMVREIADRMRRAPDMDALIKTTVQAMAGALGTSDAFLQLSGLPGTTDTVDQLEHIL